MHSSPASSTYDAIVAGVGSVGSAACYHLARRGARVLGIERFTIPHTRGSHHGHSRMIRQAYYEHPDYVPLLRRAYQLWEALQADAAATQFFHITGGLYLGPEDGAIVAGSQRAAREHALDHSMLTAGEARDRFPAFRPRHDHAGFYEDRAGFLVPEAAVTAHAEAAQRHGASLLTGEALLSWREHAGHVEVVTENATYRAAHLVITSGAWSAEVAADLGIDLMVTRQVLAWFRPAIDPKRLAPGRFPCWFIETDPPFGHYGFPILPGDPGLKVALHKPGEGIAPPQIAAGDQQPRPDEVHALRTVLDSYLPGCAGPLAHACICMYTNSPDSHFILGCHPRHPRVSIACGLSGHGFKFASVLGEVLADLALEGRTGLPIDFLSPARFR